LNDKEHAYHPVVFCRYITTAHYVGKHLKKLLPDVTVEVITGEQPSDEREARVARLGEVEGHRVLVATDCLSEGINLQDLFDAVIHYDLSWNPTRHEQREGRVDRFGQTSPTVRATLDVRHQQPRRRGRAQRDPPQGRAHPQRAGRPRPGARRRALSDASALEGSVLLRRKGRDAAQSAR
jgi:superfamily II DNA/RNA helicase